MNDWYLLQSSENQHIELLKLRKNTLAKLRKNTQWELKLAYKMKFRIFFD